MASVDQPDGEREDDPPPLTDEDVAAWQAELDRREAINRLFGSETFLQFGSADDAGELYESVVDDGPAEPVEPDYKAQLGKLKLEGHSDTLKLRRRLGVAAIVLMAVQLAVADVAFFFYGEANDWKIPGEVVIGWLSSVVVQVVGVVFIVAKNLFPANGKVIPDGD